MPDAEWLKYAVTAKARTNIKQYLKEQQRKLNILGKEKLETLFQQFNLPDDKSTIQKFLDFQTLKSPDDLYYMLANGDIGLKRSGNSARKVKRETCSAISAGHSSSPNPSTIKAWLKPSWKS